MYYYDIFLFAVYDDTIMQYAHNYEALIFKILEEGSLLTELW